MMTFSKKVFEISGMQILVALAICKMATISKHMPGLGMS
jgi:hypothetical protein